MINMNIGGLNKEIWQDIKNIFEQNKSVKKAVLFGSRSKNTYKKTSGRILKGNFIKK